MIAAYITVGFVCGIAISYGIILHYFWLRDVFQEAPGTGEGESNKTATHPRALINKPANRRLASPGKRIIILGGGFAGVKCAQTLSRALRGNDAEIVLFNAENHFVFTPLLARRDWRIGQSAGRGC